MSGDQYIEESDEEESEEETEDEATEEEEDEEESGEEDSQEEMREGDPVEEGREVHVGEPVEVPVKESVVAPVGTEDVLVEQVPIPPSDIEPGQEEGDIQLRDIHMIIPPIVDPLSPFCSPLHTVSLDPISPFSEGVFAAPKEEYHFYADLYISTTTSSITTIISIIITPPISTTITRISTTPSRGPRGTASSYFITEYS